MANEKKEKNPVPDSGTHAGQENPKPVKPTQGQGIEEGSDSEQKEETNG